MMMIDDDEQWQWTMMVMMNNADEWLQWTMTVNDDNEQW